MMAVGGEMVDASMRGKRDLPSTYINYEPLNLRLSIRPVQIPIDCEP
jgi:hypothetical protein